MLPPLIFPGFNDEAPLTFKLSISSPVRFRLIPGFGSDFWMGLPFNAANAFIFDADMEDLMRNVTHITIEHFQLGAVFTKLYDQYFILDN
jgi:hypothetical protein